MEIRREGGELIGLSSPDGENWTEVGRAEVVLPEPFLIGMVLSGRDIDPESSFTAAVARLSHIDGPVTAPSFIRADCNDDGEVDISDAISTLGALFLGQGEITCQDACDSNDDGQVDLSDPIATLGVLFLGNGVIPLPGGNDCGVDPTDDDVGCVTFEPCP